MVLCAVTVKSFRNLNDPFEGLIGMFLKVIWGSGWDELLARDNEGELKRRMEECLDGDYQSYSMLPGDLQREHWVEGNPALEKLMNSLSDEEVRAIKKEAAKIRRKSMLLLKSEKTVGKPTVILIKTVKGDGMGAQGKNTAHQYKNIPREERTQIAAELGVPLDKESAEAAEFYRPPEDAPEIIYLKEKRQKLGGYIPNRTLSCPSLIIPELERFGNFLDSSKEREMSTTGIMVRLLASLLKLTEVQRYIVPIVPDEARTLVWRACSRQRDLLAAGPVIPIARRGFLDALQRGRGWSNTAGGITEVGAIASFMAAGSAYSVHGLPMIPFYFFYSMFGMQRVGDMIWSCGDMMCKGFLLRKKLAGPR